MKEHLIRIEHGRCIGCGLCRRDCPAGNIALSNGKAEIITQSCIKCGHCVAVCPKAAVSMTGFDEQPVEIKGPSVLEPQALLEAVRTRRSIRQFADRPVAPEIIEQVIEAGRLTPTGGNSQGVSYLVLKKEMARFEKMAVRFFRRLQPLAKLVNPTAGRVAVDDHFFFKKAPAAILVLSESEVDGALAASNMELMAEACGLGVLYSGFFALAANRSRPIRKALGLARKNRVVTTLVIGYAGVAYHRTVPKESASVHWR